jgi:hypothetical protein
MSSSPPVIPTRRSRRSRRSGRRSGPIVPPPPPYITDVFASKVNGELSPEALVGFKNDVILRIFSVEDPTYKMLMNSSEILSVLMRTLQDSENSSDAPENSSRHLASLLTPEQRAMFCDVLGTFMNEQR